MDRLKLFFTSIKEISFFERIFKWSKIRSLSFDAYSEFESLNKKILDQDDKINNLEKLIEKINSLSWMNINIYFTWINMV